MPNVSEDLDGITVVLFDYIDILGSEVAMNVNHVNHGLMEAIANSND